MAPVVDMSALFLDTIRNSQYSSAQLDANISRQNNDDYLSLVRQQAENRLLNTQSLIEYELLKSRLLGTVTEMNKFFEADDQIIIQEYKLCASLSYRKRIFVMEFRQIMTATDRCNHALELIFRPSANDFNDAGHSILILNREHKQFIWQQLQFVSGGPAGTSKAIVGLILRWLQNDNSLYLRTAPVLIFS